MTFDELGLGFKFGKNKIPWYVWFMLFPCGYIALEAVLLSMLILLFGTTEETVNLLGVEFNGIFTLFFM